MCRCHGGFDWRSMRRLAWILALTVLGIPIRAVTSQPPPLSRMPDLQATHSVLVVAPHPDDESLCCGGLIELARRAGARVTIAWVTLGDGSRLDAIVTRRTLRPGPAGYRSLAERRAGEARAAADILSVPRSGQFLLGYPDRGILPLTVAFHSSPWRSRRTQESAVYLPEAFAPGSAYEGQNLERDLARVVQEVHPTLVLAPSPQDAHPDHRGTGLMTLRVMSARGELDRVRYWIVHGGRGWPRPRALRPDLPQTPPPRGAGMEWEYVPLDSAARETKRRAIQAHASQMKVMGRIMISYVRATELYARVPAPQIDAYCAAHGSCVSPDESLDEFAHVEGGSMDLEVEEPERVRPGISETPFASPH